MRRRHDARVAVANDEHAHEGGSRPTSPFPITPSKHTPKPLGALKRSVAADGPLRPFRLLKQDLKNLRGRYVSDWTLFNQLIIASSVYVFFTNLLPGITFASDLYVLTGQNWGTIEVVFSTGLCGVVFSFFDIPFLPFMAWALIHSAWMHILLAVFNAHDWTMCYVTTFSTEIFSLLNSIIYFHKAIQELQRVRAAVSFAAFLYAIIGAIGTTLVALALSTAERWEPLFHRYIRMGLAEYAAAISIILFTGLPHVGELASLDGLQLAVSTVFKPTSPDRTSFFVQFWHLPAGWCVAAMLPGLIITCLFFFDHEVSSIICTIDRYNTRKPGGFAWDIVLLGLTTGLCGILGIPPANGLLPQAPLHSESLMHDEVVEKTYVDPDDGVERKEEVKLRSVYEQRWSAFIHSGAILAFISPPLQRVLGLTPTSVLAGLFIYMGIRSLSVNPILYRFFYLLTPISDLPALPPAVVATAGGSSVRGYMGVHLYTVLQILLTVLIFVVTLTKGAPVFPVLILVLIPARLLVMKKMWNRETLRFVDAWACKEGTPEDDEDRRREGDRTRDVELEEVGVSGQLQESERGRE